MMELDLRTPKPLPRGASQSISPLAGKFQKNEKLTMLYYVKATGEDREAAMGL